MPGTFFGLNTALRGLEAQQTAMDVASHNIANASTAGYSRQAVDLQTTDPFDNPSTGASGAGQIGTGVTVASIQRAHDGFVQQQIIYQNGVQAQQQALSDTLDGISQVFNDPSSQGFSSLLSSYFTSWQDLANNPSDAAARTTVASRGAALASGFNATASALVAQQQNQNQQVGMLVGQVNTLTGQIAALNGQIASVVATGQQPNDLQDKRDTLVNQLSQIVDIQYSEEANGTASISLAGAGTLVEGTTAVQLATVPNPANGGYSDVTFQGQATPLALTGGQLGGAITARDQTIASRLSALDTLAGNVAAAVNSYQSAGYGSNGATGIPFFTGTTASTIAVNTQITSDPANIAASAAPNSPADGSQALAIAQLQENPPPGGTVTLQAQYGSIISGLGVDAQQAQNNVQTGSLVLQNLTAQQSSVSSVSLNEEASNLVQYQNAYQAAAHVISIIDQSISDMIQQLGG